MGNKLSATVYWLIAGSWIFLGLAQLPGSPFQSVKLWQIGVGELCVIALLLGLRWCIQVLRTKRRAN
jgi:hypothetical protein